jgi:hypothetical protein
MRKRNTQPVSPVAATVIERCGGVQAVSRLLEIDVSRVYRFTYPKSKGGTGGWIPQRHQHVLLAKVRELSPADFFEARAAQ